MVDSTTRRAAILAHPGHELRAYHWLEQSAAVVYVMTDGSGGSGSSRLPSSRDLLESIGCTPGRLFGTFTDVELYGYILRQETDALVAWAREVAELLAAGDVDLVLADAAEGYNTAHDLCRYLANAVVDRLAATRDRPISNFALPLRGSPAASSLDAATGDVVVRLPDDAVERKLVAARRYTELRGEVEADLSAHGKASFAAEHFMRVSPQAARVPAPTRPIFYEEFGERRVAEGLYDEVIRFDTHLRPLAESIRSSLGCSVDRAVR
jgi:hypothetical protein